MKTSAHDLRDAAFFDGKRYIGSGIFAMLNNQDGTEYSGNVYYIEYFTCIHNHCFILHIKYLTVDKLQLSLQP